MTTHEMTIAGGLVRSEETFGVVNPATGKVFAHAPECSPAELDRAMDSATAAFQVWRRDEAARRTALGRAAELLSANVEPLARLLTEEQGKPVRAATREVLGASLSFAYHSKLEIPVETTHADERSRIEVRRQPLGVVGAITPWNFPILIAAAKLAPALLAGNTVVLKPSPYTPLSTLYIGRLLAPLFPAGVLNVVSGGDDLGRRMSEHSAVRKISFTGSVATGKKVLASGAPDLKRVTLELGGNDAAIVCADADPKKIVADLFWAAFFNSGQICTAIKRLYVHESIFEPVVAGLSEVAQRVKVGPGLEPTSDLGPINNAPQFRRVCELFQDAQERGGRVRSGRGPRGSQGESGYFFEPTLVTGLADDARLVAEEQFGPVLPVLPFSDEQEALERANRTSFGLSGSVWTSDVERGAELARGLEVGTAWVNQHINFSPAAPFGGAKSSGIGYESGRWGLDSFCQLQAVNVRLS